jgi:hypothetical protein
MEKFLVGFEDTAALAVPPEIYEVRKQRMKRLIELGAPMVVIRNEAVILLTCFKT